MTNCNHNFKYDKPEHAALKFKLAFELDWDKVCMLEPVYLPDGTNGCRVYYDDGTHDDMYCRQQLVVNAWAEQKHTSVDVAKRLYRMLSGNPSKHRPTLPFQPELCLVAVKCRRRTRHNDCASGYVVLNKVRRVIVKTGGGSYIQFAGNPYPVPVLESRRSVLRNLAQARLVADAYRKSQVQLTVTSREVLF